LPESLLAFAFSENTSPQGSTFASLSTSTGVEVAENPESPSLDRVCPTEETDVLSIWTAAWSSAGSSASATQAGDIAIDSAAVIAAAAM
jgi:hypothetical protein